MSWRRSFKRKGRNEDSEDAFGEFTPFDIDFRMGFEDIDEMVESMFKTVMSAERESAGPRSIYYGYSVSVGPDGKPHVREFGNARPTSRGTFEFGSREPFVDTVVDEKEGKLKLVAEMPGIEKEDIHLDALEDSLRINAERGDRKYDANVPLKVPVDPSTASATYNNGVLEVNIRLKGNPRPKGFSVRVD